VLFLPYARLPQPGPADPLRIGRRLAIIALAAAAAGHVAVVSAALTFRVSVCLDDFEYSIACRERSSLEAAHRLEEIYLDDYATGNPAGSLRVWFAVKAEPSEQSNFLHEVENRAVEAVFRKLKEEAAHRTATATASAASASGAADAARKFAQDIQHWYDEAGVEARTLINWSHDWSARSHTYKPGQALHDLARIGNSNKQNVDHN
jgi:hypothetical protein